MACNRLAEDFASSVDKVCRTGGLPDSVADSSSMAQREYTCTSSNTSNQATMDSWTPWNRQEPDDWHAAQTSCCVSSPDRRLVRSVDRHRLRLSSNRRVQRMEDDPVDESMARWQSDAIKEERFSDSEDDERPYHNLVKLLAKGSLSPIQSSQLCFLGCPRRSVDCSSTHCAVSGINLLDIGYYGSDGRFIFYTADDLSSIDEIEDYPTTEEDDRYMCEHEGDCSDDEFH